MKVLTLEQEVRRRDRWTLRGKHPVCKAVYLTALIAMILLGGIIRVVCLDSSVWLELYRCLAPLAIAAAVFYLLRRYPILGLLRDHPGIGAMLLCYLLGLLCMVFYRFDYRESINIWPAFMFVSVLIVAATSFAMQGYWRCTPCFVTGSAAIIAMLSLGMGNSFAAMLALLLAPVLGCIAACRSVSKQKKTCCFRCVCVIGIWFITVCGFAIVSDTFCMGVLSGFTDHSVSPLDPRGIDKFYDILRTCRFLGASETGVMPEFPQYNVMLSAAVKFGWGFFTLLILMMILALITGVILVAQWKGMARLLGAGAIVALLCAFLGEPLRAFGIESPFLYTVPFLSGNTYASTMTLLTAILVFPFARETVYPFRTNFLYRELEEVHHYLRPGREEKASCMVMRSLPLPEWALELAELFEGKENLIHLKENELYIHLSGKDHCTICRYYGAIWNVVRTFEQLSFRGEYVAVKVTANRKADAEELLYCAKKLAETTLTDDAGCCIGIDNTLEDDAVSIHMVIV